MAVDRTRERQEEDGSGCGTRSLSGTGLHRWRNLYGSIRCRSGVYTHRPNRETAMGTVQRDGQSSLSATIASIRDARAAGNTQAANATMSKHTTAPNVTGICLPAPRTGWRSWRGSSPSRSARRSAARLRPARCLVPRRDRPHRAWWRRARGAPQSRVCAARHLRQETVEAKLTPA